MQLTKEQIQHIANLSRLDLTNEELEKYGGQISSVLDYIDQLSEVDVSGIEPTAQVTGMTDVFRDDVIKDWDRDEINQALIDAPEIEDNQIKVRRVIE